MDIMDFFSHKTERLMNKWNIQNKKTSKIYQYILIDWNERDKSLHELNEKRKVQEV